MSRRLSEQQIAQLWVQRGGDPQQARLMAAIAKRESGGRPGINNRGLNQNGTVDWGLFQVNDVWRKDPVIGKLFKNGRILTAEGATDAAIRILKVQGPKAWATYNPSTDKKYLGGFKGGGTKAAPPTIGSPPEHGNTTSAQPRQDVEGAILDSFMGGRSKGTSLFQDITRRIDSGSYLTTPEPPKQRSAPPTVGGTTGSPLKQASGAYKIAPTANRKGAAIKPYALDFAARMAGIGGSFTIGTGTNHNRLTVNGNVSDHWDGSAFDIPATGKNGDKIAYTAFRAAGVPDKKARLWSRNGGLYNVNTPRGRVQIIWKTNEGGNHFNHVHVGIRPGK